MNQGKYVFSQITEYYDPELKRTFTYYKKNFYLKAREKNAQS